MSLYGLFGKPAGIFPACMGKPGVFSRGGGVLGAATLLKQPAYLMNTICVSAVIL